MKKNKKLIFFGVLFLISSINANVCFAASEPASFLLLGVGARPLGMGGAFTAIADESSTVYWNPAGMSLMEKRELSGMYGSVFDNTSYSFISYAGILSHPKDELSADNSKQIALGVGWLQLKSTGIEKTGQTGLLGDTQMVNDALFFSGSIRPLVSFPLYLGITGKRISQKLDTFSSAGFGVDIGALIDKGFFRWGMNIQNIGTTKLKGDAYWGTGKRDEVMPTHIRSGVLFNVKKAFSSLSQLLQEDKPVDQYSIYESRISQDPQALEFVKSAPKKKNELIDIEVNIAFDLDFVPGQETDAFTFYQGLECWLNNTYGLRVSFVDGFSTGASMKFKYFKLDYAFILNNKLGDTQRVSLTTLF